MMTGLGANVGEIESMFSSIDTDHSGEIDFAEFCAAVRRPGFVNGESPTGRSCVGFVNWESLIGSRSVGLGG